MATEWLGMGLSGSEHDRLYRCSITPFAAETYLRGDTSPLRGVLSDAAHRWLGGPELCTSLCGHHTSLASIETTHRRGLGQCTTLSQSTLSL